MLAMVVTALLSASPIGDKTCGLWEGVIQGNDPHVTARLLMCRRGSELCGQMLWAGQSGDAVRELTGTLDPGGGLDLRDTRFLKSAPKRGWRFCLADGYRLDRDEKSGALVGRYWSTACHDEATISLNPVKRSESPMIASCFSP
jgi:hypothetical protein